MICRADTKHLFENCKRVDYFEGDIETDGLPVPDPCPNSKTGVSRARMYAEATHDPDATFRSSSRREDIHVACPKCLQPGLYIQGAAAHQP